MTREASRSPTVDAVESDVSPLRLHWRRRLVGHGYREVRLTVRNGRSVQYDYRIGHTWNVESRECRSLFHLYAPKPIAGTSLLIVERPSDEVIGILLRFPGLGPANEIASEYAGDAVLGTDFSYEDLRFWLPFDSLSNQITLSSDDPSVTVIEGIRCSRFGRISRLRVGLDRQTWDRKWVQHLSKDGAVERELTVHEAGPGSRSHGSRVIVSDARRGYESELQELNHRADVRPAADLLLEELRMDRIASAMAAWRTGRDVN